MKTHNTYFIISRSILLRIFANLPKCPRTSGTAVTEMWHKSWSIIYIAKFHKANVDCTQRRDSFQQGTWSLTKSSSRRHCIVSGLCVTADNECSKFASRSYLVLRVLWSTTRVTMKLYAVIKQKVTKWTMYVEGNNEERSRNQCCRGKALRSKKSACL